MSNPFATPPAHGDYRDVTPADVAAHRDQFRLVDVREPSEYHGELGHIPGAELVPLASVMAHAQTWNKDQEIVVVCRSGGRSGQAASALARMGFGRISNMIGGMIRWNGEHRPVER